MKSSNTPHRRTRWLKTLHQWHWMSSALSLIGLILFAATGITLNNAALFESKPAVHTQQAALPGELLEMLAPPSASAKKGALPKQAEEWLDSQLDIRIGGRTAEFSEDEVYVSLPEPGGDAWLSIDRASGDVTYERSRRGWIAYLNDLHKGRSTGVIWSWFIDIFAGACLIFALSGLLLLKLHSKNRISTWPMVGLGLFIPFILLLIFSH